MSREILVLTVLAYTISSFLLSLSTQSVDVAALSGMVDAILLASITHIILLMWRRSERWMQTTMALCGTGIIFSLFALPFSYLLANSTNSDPLAFLLFIFVISLLLWNIAVMAHIIRHALSASFALGVLLALFYVWVITAAVTSLFPTAAESLS